MEINGASERVKTIVYDLTGGSCFSQAGSPVPLPAPLLCRLPHPRAISWPPGEITAGAFKPARLWGAFLLVS